MFSKNIEALKTKNPVLAQKLQEMTIEEAGENIEVYEAESKDYFISYSGLALDDIYDPIRVAKTTWNINVDFEVNKHDIIVVFGLGLGYIFKRAYVNSNCRVVLYEPKLDIMRFVLEYVDFSDVISDDRVYITCDRKDCLNFITHKYLSTDKLVFLYPKAYEQLATQEFIEFTNNIVEVCSLKKMDIGTIKKLAKSWANHSLSNMLNMKNSRPVSWLNKCFEGKTALVLAAGPSLKENIEFIKANRNKFVIFAVNRPLRFLLENGIKPDFAVFSDVVEGVEYHLEGIEDKLSDVIITADTRVNKYVYENFSNILNYYSQNDLISSYLSEITAGEITLFETACSAVMQAYYTAKTMGISKIIFTGLDLALKDNEIYSDGMTVDITSKDNAQMGGKGFKKVKGVSGEDVWTREDYAIFISLFSDIFSDETDMEIFNTSNFGALIRGMKYSSLDEICKDMPDLDLDIKEFVSQFFNSTTDRWDKVYTIILNMLKEEKKTLLTIEQKANFLLTDEKNLLDKIIADKEIDLSSLGFDKLAQEFVNLTNIVINDAFLSQYFQSEFADFVSANSSSINQGIDAFINLKHLEVDILQGIVDICKLWYEFLEEKLES